MRISPKLSEIDICLLGNSSRDWESAISSILGVFRLALRPFRLKWVVGLVNVVNGSVGTVTSQHHTGHHGRPAVIITDDTLFILSTCPSHYIFRLRILSTSVIIWPNSGLISWYLLSLGLLMPDNLISRFISSANILCSSSLLSTRVGSGA